MDMSEPDEVVEHPLSPAAERRSWGDPRAAQGPSVGLANYFAMLIEVPKFANGSRVPLHVSSTAAK
jgi:hypothetical protein